jgi:glycerol-3-phosphate acyltransferase PlsY
MISSTFGALALAYLLGSIPFGLLVTRAAGLGDLRQLGSGNIGATNVMRTGHKGLGILTLLLDLGKGFAAIELARLIYFCDFTALTGLFAVLGHVFPVWLRFKGGKGVATTIGVLLALNVALGLTICAIWLVTFAITRISSLSSIMAIGYSAIAAYVLADELVALLCLTLAVLIVFTHRANIKRLLQGSETSFRRPS